MKIKVGDTLKITAGRDKGKTGKVEKIIPELRGGSVVVTGINLYKKHVKAKSGRPGEMAEKIHPLPMGNIALVCPKCNKVTRVGYELDKEGKKIRICRKCKGAI